MGSGHFYKKRTDFAWVDRQPAFITGGAPGLHMYSIYSTSFSQDGFLASVVTIFIYSTVCIQCIYCIYTVRLRARWRCSEIGTHHLNFVNSTSIMSMYCTVYTVYTVCTVYTVRFRARSFINLNSYHVSVQYCILYINTVHTVQLMQYHTVYEYGALARQMEMLWDRSVTFQLCKQSDSLKTTEGDTLSPLGSLRCSFAALYVKQDI